VFEYPNSMACFGVGIVAKVEAEQIDGWSIPTRLMKDKLIPSNLILRA
jgi:hypothetical protein